MPQPYDYSTIMGRAASLTDVVPGIQEALLGQQQLQANAMKLEQERQAMAQQQAFQQDIGQAINSGSEQAIAAVLGRYPKFAEAGKAAWSVYNDAAKQSKLIGLSDVKGYLEAKDYDGARRVLQQHMEADRAAGMDVSGYAPLEQAFGSNNPNLVMGITNYLIASADPDKYAERLNALDPQIAVQREYDWRVGKFGQAEADKWLAVQDSKLVPVQKGGMVYNAADLVSSSAGGGDQSTGADSSGQEPLTFAQFKAYADVQGPQKAAAWATQNNIPISVQTPAEANALPKGVRYITPDGKVYQR